MKRIYISDALHQQLKSEARREGRTLQWVVENRLSPDIKGVPDNIDPPKKITPLETPVCCTEPTPCKHWVWDLQSGEGYINSLTGEVRHVAQ